MHIHACSCMFMYGQIWSSCMVMYDHNLSCMVIFCYVWSCMVLFGHVWSCMLNKWNIAKMRNLKSIRIWNEGEKRNFVGIGNIGKIQKWKIGKSGEKEMSVK